MFTIALITSIFVAFGIHFIAKSLRYQRLMKYPGPLLAKWTTWYRAYYELVKKGGWVRQLEKLHAVYGPIVRVGPNELHFSDSRAYLEIHAPGSRFHKDSVLYSIFGNSTASVFTTPDPQDAALMRNVLAPYLSRRAIVARVSVIQEKVIDLISRLKTHTYESGNPANLDLALPSVALDALTSLIFSKSFDVLSAPMFDHPFIRRTRPFYMNIWIKKYLPGVYVPVLLTFTRFLSAFKPVANVFADQFKLVKEELDLALKGVSTHLNETPNLSCAAENSEYSSGTATTEGPLYPFLLQKIQAQIQKSTAASCETSERLQQLLKRGRLIREGFNLRFAGTDTTANTCLAGIRYLLSNIDVLKRLVEELDEAWPKDGDIAFEDLEKLPYLTAVIKESLRLSHGVVSPLARVVGPGDAMIVGETIPAGTIVGISSTFVHLNPELFPGPTKFNPERWLKSSERDQEKNFAAAEINSDKYLVSFSRGPRSCIGIHLAWCELYIIFGFLFRKLELIPQTEMDPSQLHFDDFFLPSYAGDPLFVFVRERLTSLN